MLYYLYMTQRIEGTLGVESSDEKLASGTRLQRSVEGVNEAKGRLFSSRSLGGFPYRNRDFERWPEIGGYPLIAGGSGEEESRCKAEINAEELIPVANVSEEAGLSAVRIKALLHEGIIEGELRREGRGLGKWYTSVAAVDEYRKNLPTPQDFGRMGGRPKKAS
jgi:hypothetical protein